MTTSVNTVEQAQSVLDGIMLKLGDYKIPANQQTIKFLETMLNSNGFSGVRVCSSSSSKPLKPIVMEASEYNDLFGEIK